MKASIWTIVGLFVAVVGGFFSIGLWSTGMPYHAWKSAAYLGLVMLAMSIGLGAIVHLLGRLAAQSGN